jgi:predicted RNA-binding Zn-ribbon protein involved in translation (DUF1610 family)
MKKEKRGGFKKVPDPLGTGHTCSHPEHNPPGQIVLPPGLYEYTCPGCGRSIVIRIREIKCRKWIKKGGSLPIRWGSI